MDSKGEAKVAGVYLEEEEELRQRAKENPNFIEMCLRLAIYNKRNWRGGDQFLDDGSLKSLEPDLDKIFGVSRQQLLNDYLRHVLKINYDQAESIEKQLKEALGSYVNLLKDSTRLSYEQANSALRNKVVKTLKQLDSQGVVKIPLLKYLSVDSVPIPQAPLASSLPTSTSALALALASSDDLSLASDGALASHELSRFFTPIAATSVLARVDSDGRSTVFSGRSPSPPPSPSTLSTQSLAVEDSTSASSLSTSCLRFFTPGRTAVAAILATTAYWLLFSDFAEKWSGPALQKAVTFDAKAGIGNKALAGIGWALVIVSIYCAWRALKVSCDIDSTPNLGPHSD